MNLLLRLPGLYTQFYDIDETQFAGFAHVLMNGGLPYLDSLDTKPLGIYLFYRLCFEIFGRHNMVAVHAVTTLLFFCGAFVLSRIFRELGRASAGRWAALFYVIGATTFIPKYLATSINSVMVFFLIVSAWGIAKSVEVLKYRSVEVGDGGGRGARGKKKIIWAIFSGVMLGLAFLFKYTCGTQLGLFFFVSLFLMAGAPLFLDASADHEPQLIVSRSAKNWFNFVLLNIVFVCAFLVPFTLHGWYLCHKGVWSDFVQWSLLGSERYVAQGQSTIILWKSFLIRFGGYVLATVYLWIALAKAFHTKMLRDKAILFFLVWFGLSLIPVCVGGRFYGHYFLHLLPALCGMAALGFERLVSPRWRQWIVGLMILSTSFFFVLRINLGTYYKYLPDDKIEIQKEIGERLAQIAQPTDKIFAWGFATGIYFYSGLEPASRFLWTDLLTGRIPGPNFARTNLDQEYAYANPMAWQAFWDDMEKNKPEFFVDTAPANIHGYKRFPIQKFAELWKYVQENYTKVEVVEGVEIYKRKN